MEAFYIIIVLYILGFARAKVEACYSKIVLYILGFARAKVEACYSKIVLYILGFARAYPNIYSKPSLIKKVIAFQFVQKWNHVTV